MASTIQVRVDDEIKSKADMLFKDLGMDTTTAIRIFLTQAIANDGFPFEIKKKTINPYRTLSESEFMDKQSLQNYLKNKKVNYYDFKKAHKTLVNKGILDE